MKDKYQEAWWLEESSEAVGLSLWDVPIAVGCEQRLLLCIPMINERQSK